MVDVITIFIIEDDILLQTDNSVLNLKLWAILLQTAKSALNLKLQRKKLADKVLKHNSVRQFLFSVLSIVS